MFYDFQILWYSMKSKIFFRTVFRVLEKLHINFIMSNWRSSHERMIRISLVQENVLDDNGLVYKPTPLIRRSIVNLKRANQLGMERN